MLKSLQNKLNTYRTNEINTCEIYISKNKWNELSREMERKYVYIYTKMQLRYSPEKALIIV